MAPTRKVIFSSTMGSVPGGVTATPPPMAASVWAAPKAIAVAMRAIGASASSLL